MDVERLPTRDPGETLRDVIAKQMTATDANKLIDEAIATVDSKLH